MCIIISMKRRPITLFVTAVIGSALFGSVYTESAGAFTANDVVGGTQTIYNLDTNNVGHANPTSAPGSTQGIDNQGALSNGPSCRQEIYNAAGAAGKSVSSYMMNGGLSDNIQAASGGGVRSLWWLSQKGNPGNGNTISIRSGQQVTLQANYMLFFCAPSTGPTFGNVSAQYLFDHSPWTQPDKIIDGRPILSGQQGQSYQNVYWQTQSAKVSTDQAGNNSAAIGNINITNRSSTVNRNSSTRFWVGAPSTQFTFTPNFTGTREIYVTSTAKSIRHYSNGDYICNGPNNKRVYVAGPHDWGRCAPSPQSWKFTITVDNHELTPTVQVAPSNVPLGAGVSVQGSITENQNVDVAANWNIARIVYKPGANVPGNKNASTDITNPCTGNSYRGGESSCYYANYNATKYNFSKKNGYSAANNSTDAVNWPVGTTICYVTSVNNYSVDKKDSDWKHSDMKCTVVSKAPKLSISGGDLRTLADVDTSRNVINGKTYGSWVEYGAFIDGVSQNGAFGSGAALRGGSGSAAPSVTNPLTFANAKTSAATPTGPYGSFGGAAAQTTLADQMAKLLPKSGNVGGVVNLGSLASGTYSASTNFSVSGAVGQGKSIIINAPDRAVTISGDITYSGNPGSIDQIQQVVIVAKSITIAAGIKTVDAWLLAPVDTKANPSVNLATCDIGGATMESSLKVGEKCDKNQLSIHGPVTANKAHFYRTAGADNKDNQDQVSESLSLPSNTYLWEYNQASKNAAPTTVQVTQLPPRY